MAQLFILAGRGVFFPSLATIPIRLKTLDTIALDTAHILATAARSATSPERTRPSIQ